MNVAIDQNREIHAGSAAFDLDNEVEALCRSIATDSAELRKVLVASTDFQIVLRILPANSRIADHHDHGRISVQTVRGHIRVHAGGEEYDLRPGNVAVIDQGVTHGIDVLEDSAFLLTASMHAHPARTTEPFRQEHVEIRAHLSHISSMIEAIAKAPAAEAQQRMQHLVGALRAHILAHADWEERVLYPVIDMKAGPAPHRFTEAMRLEHRIVGRWIDELDRQSNRATADVLAFARRADQLLGLILAHFEEEEEVLLPIIDATMTREEFEREILSKETPHPQSSVLSPERSETLL